MPEYLSPGVFIEEIPARLKAIEGVSTSTAGFVGESLRGIVPGWTPQRGAVVFGTKNGLQFVRDDAPVLVTSFGEYRRWFGAPPDDPTVDGYYTSSNFTVSGTTFSTVTGEDTVANAWVGAIGSAKKSILIASGHLRSRLTDFLPDLAAETMDARRIAVVLR